MKTSNTHLNKRHSVVVMLVVLVLIGICGCLSEQRQAKGFRLPDGDIAKGKEAFTALQCHTCHQVTGVTLPKAESPGQHNVTLGGEVYKVKTYGELVTAVIHPSHDISLGFDAKTVEGELSPMPEFNQMMTVEQMIDITAFLHSRYRERPVEYNYYGY